jgi:hypothetical protein
VGLNELATNVLSDFVVSLPFLSKDAARVFKPILGIND